MQWAQVALFFFVLCFTYHCQASESVTIQTELGRWTGLQTENSFIFDGIPYAQYPFFFNI